MNIPIGKYTALHLINLKTFHQYYRLILKIISSIERYVNFKKLKAREKFSEKSVFLSMRILVLKMFLDLRTPNLFFSINKINLHFY